MHTLLLVAHCALHGTRLRPACLRAAAPRAAIDTATFEEWATSSGISAPKLRIEDLEELRGAVAQEPVAQEAPRVGWS